MKKMKTIFTGILCLMMALCFLTACHRDAEPADSEEGQTEQEVASVVQTEKADETERKPEDTVSAETDGEKVDSGETDTVIEPESETKDMTDTEAPEETDTNEAGEESDANTEPPHEHVYGEWVEATSATCTEAGEEARVCVCGDTDLRVLVAKGHQMDIDRCKVCGIVLTASSGLEFTSNGDGTCWISSIGTCSDTIVVIPSISPEGESVTRIGEVAFGECTELTTIIIPNSVTIIEDSAFALCENLVSITIPDGVTEIGDYAFMSCKKLENIYIPASVTSIGDYVFRFCRSLTNVYISEGVESIGETVFQYCDNLISIYFPESVTSIGNRVIFECVNLVNITVASDNQVYHSNGNCLIETSSKTLIAGCRNSVIPAEGSVTSIAEGAFPYCTTLTNIMIPNTVTNIGSWAFDGCSGLTSIEIPSSMTSIDRAVFEDCGGLMSITLSDSIKSIGDGAFLNCDNLTDIYFMGTEAEWQKIYIGEDNECLTNATIHYNYVPEP